MGQFREFETPIHMQNTDGTNRKDVDIMFWYFMASGPGYADFSGKTRIVDDLKTKTTTVTTTDEKNVTFVKHH